MAIITFDIESYTVGASEHMRSTTGSYRVLTLVGRPSADGMRTRAAVYFLEMDVSYGVVTNVDPRHLHGQHAVGYCRRPDFGQWYDLLRNERPLQCRYAYDESKLDPQYPASYRTLYWIQLFTGQPEPLGEGHEHNRSISFPTPVLEALAASSNGHARDGAAL